MDKIEVVNKIKRNRCRRRHPRQQPGRSRCHVGSLHPRRGVTAGELAFSDAAGSMEAIRLGIWHKSGSSRS